MPILVALIALIALVCGVVRAFHALWRRLFFLNSYSSISIAWPFRSCPIAACVDRWHNDRYFKHETNKCQERSFKIFYMQP